MNATPSNPLTSEPYRPACLPLEKLDWGRLVPALGKANRAIAHYDGVLRSIPNPAILLSPLTSNEAVLSSKIEGTQATLQEVLEFESGADQPDPERRADIHEILNYRKALQAAQESLGVKPLHLGTLQNVHSILLNSVRGHDKARGQFRITQNWIGQRGTNMGQARFVPPSPLELPDALTNFENYLHHEESDPIAQLGIVHAQFEILHPFLDGNGRVGRILIPIFLFEKKVLGSPMFYLSAYLEAHRQEYYDRLLGVTANGDWEGWLLFFFEAMRAQADVNACKAKEILELRDSLKHSIPSTRYAIEVLDALFQAPIFKQADFMQRSGIPEPSVKRLMRELLKNGILTTLLPGGGRRAAVFGFPRLMEIVDRIDF
ncbi:Fic family protein [Opitutaceae bacterium TAV4]|nr:Fic family protein [Opitutaceae bacterium TAV4]RRJ99470.1 Fic family protein [Opitutaceae bacterium TAV3]